MVENLGVKVVFDNSHGEIVGVLSFAKEDYSALASILQLFGCKLDIIMDRIGLQHLAGTQVLIVPVPTKPFQQDEVYAVQRYVEGGGGLLLIGEYGGYANNDSYLNQLAQLFGIQFNRDIICDNQARLNAAGMDYRKAMVCPIVDGIAKHESMEGVQKLRLELSCSVTAGGNAVPLAWAGSYSFADRDFNYTADAYEQKGNVIFLAATQHGAGRVVCMGDSSLLSNENLLDQNHGRLGLNLVRWLAGLSEPAAAPPFAAPGAPAGFGGPSMPSMAPAPKPFGAPGGLAPGFPAAPGGFPGAPGGPSPGFPGAPPGPGPDLAPLPDLSPPRKAPGAPPPAPSFPGSLPFGPPPSTPEPLGSGAPEQAPKKEDKPRIPPPPPPPPRKKPP